MRTSLLGAVALAALATVGCGTTRTTFVKSETTLGRVVVYRNGVAYFERYADVQGDSLRLNVPAGQGRRLSQVAHRGRRRDRRARAHLVPVEPAGGNGGGTIDMKVGIGKPGPRARRAGCACRT